jgi:hypothetical protein
MNFICKLNELIKLYTPKDISLIHCVSITRGGAKGGPAGAMAPPKTATQTRENIYSLNFV